MQYSIGRFNASGRSLTDAIIVLEIDKPKDDGSFEYTVLSTPDFPGINNDGTLNLVGFTARNLLPAASEKGGGTEIYLVNARPSLDPLTGDILNKPNMTLESFLLPTGSTELKHISTWHHPLIQTPNNIALDPSYGLFFTNDHGSATYGFSHTLAPFMGNGDVTYCSSSPTSCRTVVGGLKFPNGLLLDSEEERIYVPSAWIGNIKVYSYSIDRRLTLVSEVEIDMPIDNLSQDSLGEIWVAGMPQARETLRAFENPLGVVASSTIFRVKSGLEGWVVEKVLEDREGEVLPGTTTVVRDVEGKRLFLSGFTSPFVTVCEEVRGG